MANLISAATGNFTAAATWGVAEAGAGSVQTNQGTAQNTTTSYVYSSAFTVTNLDVLDGLLLHCKRLNTTGTVTVSLSADGGATEAVTVTVNANDLPANQSWVFFKFGSTVTGGGTSNYKVGVKASSADNAAFYRDGTSGNWARLLRTTTTAAPAASDNLYVIKELTGAGTSNAITVTQNNTATTQFGKFDIGFGGLLNSGVAASTNYYLKTAGTFDVWAGGELRLGNVTTPVPATSKSEIEIVNVTNVDRGFEIRADGTLTTYWAAMTFVKTKLAADAAAAATSLTTVDSTGWKNGDSIILASTTQTVGDSETKALTADASGTTLTISALTNAHSGTNNANGDIRAELGNITRGVKLHGTSTSLQAYVNIAATATVSCFYTEFYWMGSALPNQRGIDTATTTGSFNMQYCALHDFVVAQSIGLKIIGPNSDANNVTFSNNVTWNIHTFHLSVSVTPNVLTFNNNLMVLNVASAEIVEFRDIGSTFTNNTMVSGGLAGVNVVEANAVLGTFSGNVAHSCGNGFLLNANISGGTMQSTTAWRNNTAGIIFNSGTLYSGVTINTATLFGNGSYGIHTGIEMYECIFINLTIDGGATQVQPIGLLLATSNNMGGLIVMNSTFGATNGHTTADIDVPSGVRYYGVVFQNCSMKSTTDLRGQANIEYGTYIGSSKHNQTAGNHKAWNIYGTISADTTIFRTASPSERLTPNNASNKLKAQVFEVAVANGAAITFSVWVRKSVVGDGAAYNGAQPRLIVLKNAAIGLNADTVLQTASAAAGTWEKLTGTTVAATDDGVFTFLVDADGTAGWVNVDDASLS